MQYTIVRKVSRSRVMAVSFTHGLPYCELTPSVRSLIHIKRLRETGHESSEPYDLARAINGGQQVFVALPDTEVGEYQSLFAALIQDYTLAAVLSRRPD